MYVIPRLHLLCGEILGMGLAKVFVELQKKKVRRRSLDMVVWFTVNLGKTR